MARRAHRHGLLHEFDGLVAGLGLVARLADAEVERPAAPRGLMADQPVQQDLAGAEPAEFGVSVEGRPHPAEAGAVHRAAEGRQDATALARHQGVNLDRRGAAIRVRGRRGGDEAADVGLRVGVGDAEIGEARGLLRVERRLDLGGRLRRLGDAVLDGA